MGDQQQQVTGTSSTQPNNPNVTSTVNSILTGVQGQLAGGPKPWNNSLFAGASPTTIQGWQQALGASQNPAFINGNQNAMNYANSLIKGGGLTGAMTQNIGSNYGIGRQYGQMAGGFRRPGIYEQTMGGVARGDELDGNDPRFQRDLTRTLDEAGAGVNSAMGAGGRYGSGAHVGQLGRTLAGISDQAYLGERERGYGRQQQALQGIGVEQQQGIGNQFAAMQGQQGANNQIFGQLQQGVANATGAAQSLPGMFQASLMPSQVTGAVGSGLDQNANASLQGWYDQWVRNNGAASGNQQDMLSWASSLLGGNAQATGATTTQTEPKPPWWQSILGGLSTGAGIAGSFIK